MQNKGFAQRLAKQHLFEPDERKAAARQYETKRLEAQKHLEERNMDERLRRKPKKSLQVEQLLEKAGPLEDDHQYESAIQLYQKALTHDSDNQELRAHLGFLIRKQNALNVLARQTLRNEDSINKDLQPVHHSLPIGAHSTLIQGLRTSMAIGYSQVPSQEEYRRQLQEQAAANAAIRKHAERWEHHLNQQILDAAADHHAKQRHIEHVGGKNMQLQHKNHQQEILAQKRQYQYQQHLIDKSMGPPQVYLSPLHGIGERVTSSMSRPSSASSRYGCPAHTWQDVTPPNSSNRPASARPAPRYPGQQPKGVPKAKPWSPFARPVVDSPVPAIDPVIVRARQEVFYSKHHKPAKALPKGWDRITPGDHVRTPDWNGYRAIQVTEDVRW